jgi:ABC-type branched-subunit amino acid transport system ATPase component
VAASAGSARADSAKAGKAPVAWGVLSGNSGSVIFAESRKAHVKFVGVFIVTWLGELDVLETQNYNMQQEQWKETRDTLNELQKLAMAEKLKFVKLAVNHSQQQFEIARAMCREPSP